MAVLVALIEAYEKKHEPIGSAVPVEAIKPCMGSSGRVSEVLNRKRRLSLQRVKRPRWLDERILSILAASL